MAGGTKITISGDLLGDNTTEVRLTVSDPLELDFKYVVCLFIVKI